MKSISKIILALTLLITLTASAKAQEKIEEFNTQIHINPDGTIKVLEQIEYNFGNNQRHGIFRDIPKTKINKDGNKYILDFYNISVTNQDGEPYKFAQTNNGGEVSLKIGDPNIYVYGLREYNINYSVSGALTYFTDHDELYWNATGDDWDVPIVNSKHIIYYPETINSSDVNASCFTGISGSTLSDCSVSLNENYVEVSTNSVLNPGEGITVVLGFPKGNVAQLEPKKDNSDLFLTIFLICLAVIGVIWYLLFPIWLGLKRNDNRKFLKKHLRVVAAWFDPPKDKFGNNLTPAEVGLLIDKKPDHKEVTATIIHLAQKGYLKIVSDDGNFTVVENRTLGISDLKSFEKLIYNGLFSKSGEVTLKDIKKSKELGKNISTFYTEVTDSLEDDNVFEKKLSTQKGLNTLYWTLSLASFNLPLILVLVIFRNYYVRLTLDGVQKYSETLSLFNFLESQDEQLDFQAKNQMFFEKLLPYATAFGVEKIWAKKFEDINFESSDWYDGDLNSVNNYALLSRNLNSSVRSSMSSYSSTTSSSGFSSGFSGGSSGGGGGGGGGGSW